MKRYRAKRKTTRCGLSGFERLVYEPYVPLYDRTKGAQRKYSTEVRDTVLNLVDRGVSLRMAAIMNNVPISTARGWR